MVGYLGMLTAVAFSITFIFVSFDRGTTWSERFAFLR
jgi:hypothetical protein